MEENKDKVTVQKSNKEIISGPQIFGIILLFLGVGILLDRTTDFSLGEFIGKVWPGVFILIGFTQMVNRGMSGIIPGLFPILIGGFWIANNFGVMPNNAWSIFWAIILILIGLTVLFSKSLNKVDPFTKSVESDDTVKNSAIFSGLTIKNSSKVFKGGEISGIFGGAELDLRDAEIDKDGAYLQINAIFGGVDIWVPANCVVVISGTPVFGGWENKSRTPENSKDLPVLKINCTAAFGGVEIK